MLSSTSVRRKISVDYARVSQAVASRKRGGKSGLQRARCQERLGGVSPRPVQQKVYRLSFVRKAGKGEMVR